MFLKTLKVKAMQKTLNFPEINLDKAAISKADSFQDFDDAFTAPIFGFENALHYWRSCSSKQYIQNIKLPSLIINALDDSFLSHSCYPFQETAKHKNVYLETPKYGGHVGFNSTVYGQDLFWSEERILTFIQDIIS